MTEETIAAIATPLGEAGLGVIRISGSEALSVAEKIFNSPVRLSRVPSHTVHYGRIQNQSQTLDDVLASVFRAPKSYTGEDVVEFSCHGSVSLLKEILGLCLAAGARMAAPGEFTRRAFMNGKMDLAQAESVADLIAAQSASFRILALEQRQGRLSGHIENLRKKTLDLLAHIEAGLDFAEEEVPDLSPESLRAGLDSLLSEVRALLATAPRGRLLRQGLRAVLVGKPNVGKSSLFNALLSSDRAIVTDVPGTTRDTLEERIIMHDVPVLLTDTAGVRPSRDPVESQGISRTQRALDQSQVALFVLDSSQSLSSEDEETADLLRDKKTKTLLVLNKADKAGAFPLPPKFKDLAAENPVRASAVTGQGLEELQAALLKAAGAAPGLDGEAPPVPTLIHARHEQLLKECAACLENARAQAGAKAADECLALDLRQALDSLGQITGQGVPEEVLDAVFSRFCIGK